MTADIRALDHPHWQALGGLFDDGAGCGATIYPVVGEQIIDGICVAAQDDTGEDIGEVGLRVDTAQFARFDEAGEGRPVFSPQVMACVQGIFPLEGDA